MIVRRYILGHHFFWTKFMETVPARPVDATLACRATPLCLSQERFTDTVADTVRANVD
jgi:hypothetical protein